MLVRKGMLLKLGKRGRKGEILYICPTKGKKIKRKKQDARGIY